MDRNLIWHNVLDSPFRQRVAYVLVWENNQLFLRLLFRIEESRL